MKPEAMLELFENINKTEAKMAAIFDVMTSQVSICLPLSKVSLDVLYVAGWASVKWDQISSASPCSVTAISRTSSSRGTRR